jgi:PilZ domain
VSDARKEKRNPRKLRVLLSPVEEPLLTEPGSTENVSPHGLRVLAEWPWPRETQLIVQSSENELWERARVVYCQTLSGNSFALGLEFLARIGEWIMRSSA